MLEDDELGNRDYRNKTTRFKEKNRTVHKRTFKDKLNRKFNNSYKHKLINKEDFEGEWPFYHNTVTIECREKFWCIVTIEDNDWFVHVKA